MLRVVQAFGSSSVLSVGAGSIGDLYRKEKRGKAMGFFYMQILLGPSLSPLLAGVFTEYIHQGWRVMQYLLLAMGFIAMALVFFALPETAHTRSIDLIQEEKQAALTAENSPDVAPRKVGFTFVPINPLAPLKILVNGHILLMAIVSSLTLASTYCILVPLASTLAVTYSINNPAILGLLYLASGFGNAVSSTFTGKHADRVLRTSLAERGYYLPEDRLKAALIGCGFFLPASVLSFGWVVEKVDSQVGLAFSILLLITNGAALMSVLVSTNTYIVDVSEGRSAEAIAANNCVRYLWSACVSAFVLPLIVSP